MRTLALAILLLPLLGGCGDMLRSDLGADLARLGSGVGERLPPLLVHAEPEPEPAGPALRLWLGSRWTHAALLQEMGERRLWRTPAGVVVATEGGRITATVGLRQMLAATRFDGPDPLANPTALLDRPAAARRQVDLMAPDREPEGMRFGVAVDCRLRAERTEEAEVLLVQERCRASGSPAFTNRFWVEAEGGAVLRAEQWVGPRLPVLKLEFLSPAR